MNEIGNFYKPEDMDYESIVPTYQGAFKESPWFEESKCVDEQPVQRCAGGLSAVAVGSVCGTCTAAPQNPAYESDELIQRFTWLGDTRPTTWYLERSEEKVALAAVSWITTAKKLGAEKYTDVPAMSPWLIAQFGEQEFIYLDEIFRDKTVRPTGNLANIGAMVAGFRQQLGTELFVFRTKNERLIGKTKDVFGASAIVYESGFAQVPDRRDFVVIQARERL